MTNTNIAEPIEAARRLLRSRLQGYMTTHGLNNTCQLEQHLRKMNPPIVFSRATAQEYLKAALPMPKQVLVLRRFLNLSDDEVTLLKKGCKAAADRRASASAKAHRKTDLFTPVHVDENDIIGQGKITLRACVVESMKQHKVETIAELSKVVDIPEGTLNTYTRPIASVSLPTSKQLKKLKRRLGTIGDAEARIIRAAAKAAIESKPRNSRGMTSSPTLSKASESRVPSVSTLLPVPTDGSLATRVSQLEEVIYGGNSVASLMAGNDSGRYNGSNGVRWQLRADNIQRLNGPKLTPAEIRDTLVLLEELAKRFSILAQMSDLDERDRVIKQLKPQIVELYTNIMATGAPSLTQMISVLQEQREIFNS